MVLVKQEVTDLSVLHEVEGLALVMMCSARVVTRKLAVHLLKEVRNIFNTANTQVHRRWLIAFIVEKGQLQLELHGNNKMFLNV